MPNCPNYSAPFEAQLGELYGGVNCTAVSAARAAAHATCGAVNTTGAHVRALTDEPVPDPNSPGLNLPQVDAALARLGVALDTRIGPSAVSIAEYESRRLSGQGCIAQISYGPIANSAQDAGNGFTGSHAIFESVHSTYDPLADGRRSRVWKFDGRVYDRGMIHAAMAQLPIPVLGGVIHHPAGGTVWAAFTVDVIPDYHVSIWPLPGQAVRKVALYTVSNGRVTSMKSSSTAHMVDPCSPPKAIRMLNGTYKSMVQIYRGVWTGKWVWAGFAQQGAA